MRTWLFVIALLLAPAAAQAARPSHATLENGIRVLLFHFRQAPEASIVVTVPFSFDAEPTGSPLSSFVLAQEPGLQRLLRPNARQELLVEPAK